MHPLRLGMLPSQQEAGILRIKLYEKFLGITEVARANVLLPERQNRV